VPADALAPAGKVELSPSSSDGRGCGQRRAQHADSCHGQGTGTQRGSESALGPLAIGAERQWADLAREVLRQLQPDHPAIQVPDAAKHPLPHDALDQLGNAQTVEAVHWLLGGCITGRPSVLVQ